MNPEAQPKEQAQDSPFPIPAPPAEIETTQDLENPFLRVSQTEVQEEAVPSDNPFAQEDAASQQPLASGHNLSKPWADALGLPAKSSEPVQQYRRN
jgi:hypothetical protein